MVLGRLEASAPREVEYPESDGKPMAESDTHRDEAQRFVIEVLEDRFEAEPRVYVSGSNFVYFVEGDPAEVVSPDAYVVFGVPKRPRRIYKVWEEGRTPRVVFEITSKSTKKEDRGSKMVTYSDLGVPEVYLFDPLAEWMTQSLRAFRSTGDRYLEVVPSSSRRFHSEALGLDLGVVDGHLRFFDPGTGMMLPTRKEALEQERARAEAERTRADAEGARADAERTRADGQQARADALAAKLRALGIDPE
ncbi:MAG: Uma2 family endonuclease [Deltaproteobacteria bacterium]|nr:Uma2 family endonuclease [Deltaproteobacteria bacterium]